MNIANSILTQFNLLHGLPYKCWIIYQTDIHYIDNLFMIAVDIKVLFKGFKPKRDFSLRNT